MEDEKNQKKRSGVNIIAIMLAFIIGLAVGNVDKDKLSAVLNADKSETTLIERRQTQASTAASPAEDSQEATEAFVFAVYITPTGKKYHLSPDCAGENKIESSLNEATDRGFEPCKRCADG